ncbi:hypothetical protein CDAR_108321 [Caerostris darwini]|uniref:Uncharacterized protein n=1 Tax=Caerostris darwini TaxID=1538125 RepID=A0AAV4PRU3_9ARAC|nr:hypothetical protein CDAR_108321 [Caerostris darwini]
MTCRRRGSNRHVFLLFYIKAGWRGSSHRCGVGPHLRLWSHRAGIMPLLKCRALFFADLCCRRHYFGPIGVVHPSSRVMYPHPLHQEIRRREENKERNIPVSDVTSAANTSRASSGKKQRPIGLTCASSPQQDRLWKCDRGHSVSRSVGCVSRDKIPILRTIKVCLFPTY